MNREGYRVLLLQRRYPTPRTQNPPPHINNEQEERRKKRVLRWEISYGGGFEEGGDRTRASEQPFNIDFAAISDLFKCFLASPFPGTMPFKYLDGKGVLEIAGFASICSEEKWKREEFASYVTNEPTSVLHMRRSPSPPTSASTLSSSFGGGGADHTAGVAHLQPGTPAAAASSEPSCSRKDEWASDLPPITTGLEAVTGGNRCGLGGGLEDWVGMMSESAASPHQEQSLLRWIAGDVDESSFGLKQLLQSGNSNPLDFESNAGLVAADQSHGFEQIGVSGNPNFPFPGSGFPCNNNGNNFPQVSLHPGTMYPQFAPDEKPQIFNSQLLMSHQQSQHHQNPNFFMGSPFTGQQEQQFLHPQPKRHNTGSLDPNPQIPKALFSDPGHEFMLRQHQNQHLGSQQKLMGPGEETGQQHALLDQLYKAAEQVGSGNFSHAQMILARLNHQLSPAGKPLHRAAFYFKEALQLLLLTNNPATPPPPRAPTPFDVIFKMGAYKLFSEVSPLIQFVNFTCNQALLEALSDADRIHIFDFDIGFGAQWASFMQELPLRNRGAPSLKITAFASPSTHHPVELELMRENLAQFACDIGLNFELEVVNLDLLDQSSYSLPIFPSSDNESVAVNFPMWASSDQPSAFPALLSLVKQLSPKIVVSLDRGCDRSDLPFPQHFLHALQSYMHLLESLDAVNATPDSVNKIERFLLQPRIESTVLGRLRAPEKMLPLRKTLFASAGFSPVSFSNHTETQAECVVRRTPVRGFHVEKRQASLVLCWQGRELVSASAWRC